MRNGSAYIPGQFSRDFSNEFRTDPTQYINCASGSRFYSSSGYTGPRPKPVANVIHAFDYQIREIGGVNIQQSEELYRPSYVGTTRSRNGDYLSSDYPYSWGIANLPNPNATYNELMEEFYEKVRGNIDLSIDIAQAGQTARMFSATKQVEDFTKTFGRKFSLLKLPASLWLQYTYGVKPLLSTVYEAAEAGVNVVLNRIERLSVRKTEKLKDLKINLYLGDNSYDILQTQSTGKLSFTLGAAYANPDGFDLSRWTSLNPVSIAWELVPYSFVADWFYDVGGYLRGLESSMLMKNQWKGGYLSKLVALDGSIKDVYADSSTDRAFRRVIGGNFRYRTFERSILETPPTPRPPTFKADLGSSRLLSAAALLSNFLGRR